MKKHVITAIALLTFGAGTLLSSAANASPMEDQKSFQEFFKKRFKDTEFSDYKNGIYSIHPESRKQWEEIEDFPPYEIAVERGEELWNTAFTNGKTYADCFGEDVTAVRAKYPHYDAENDTIATLEDDINKCRTANGEKPFGWKKGAIADLSSYIAYEGRDAPVNVKLPESEKEIAWYEKGKTFFYAKRGQLNMACADCHVYYSGRMARSETLSPALGHPTHFPVYRSKWGNMGTLHRRYAGCNENIRAKGFKAQSDEYKALEYFQTFMSNGLAFNGPGARK
ncbi:sulfur oxidation c-type cytochrome SoxA [Leucothrix pacifica]|uniref:SoxAX cytochrome complex subunit A n=1 Tax=Leucothrix pacifica TaxID=1247513 RepID=A0A317CPP5_9GAMM|nr:sulfur oxidation c-type cytochrome SoxA [Leucothrix pacifica]PWR00198.1 sulfur oxidation c-type cytochrome SoxA [Leucothrix pacifica]